MAAVQVMIKYLRELADDVSHNDWKSARHSNWRHKST